VETGRPAQDVNIESDGEDIMAAAKTAAQNRNAPKLNGGTAIQTVTAERVPELVPD
jgi:hypothetical protein